MYRCTLAIISSLLLGWNLCSAAANENLRPQDEGGGFPIRC